MVRELKRVESGRRQADPVTMVGRTRPCQPCMVVAKFARTCEITKRLAVDTASREQSARARKRGANGWAHHSTRLERSGSGSGLDEERSR